MASWEGKVSLKYKEAYLNKEKSVSKLNKSSPIKLFESPNKIRERSQPDKKLHTKICFSDLSMGAHMYKSLRPCR